MALVPLFIWAYWETLRELVRTWNTVPDYSHGYLVAPVALLLLWVRRDRFPGLAPGVAWGGAVLLAAAFLTRWAGARYFLGSIDGWSIPLWLGGVVWLLLGRRVFWWSLPSIAFLWFMVPLPYRGERFLSLPLQSIATGISTWALQVLNQPAFAEGHTILLGDHRLEVEQACSGLRVFVGILALAFAYLFLVRRPWWQRGLLLASVLPVALVANATRIVATGLLYQFVSGEAAHRFAHDLAGWVVIPFAAALFGLVLWYVGSLIRPIEVVDVASLIRYGRNDSRGEILEGT